MTATDRPHSFYLVLSHQRHYLLSHSFPSTLISLPSLLSPPKRPRFGHRGGRRGSWWLGGLPRRSRAARRPPATAGARAARGPSPAHGWAEAARPQGRGTAATAGPRATSGAQVARRRLDRARYRQRAGGAEAAGHQGDWATDATNSIFFIVDLFLKSVIVVRVFSWNL